MHSDSDRALDVFFSYSHHDEVLRDALETHLALLKREGEISTWHDRRIGAGTEWQGAIDSRLESADLILLLISPDFIASDYCFDLEMTRALERHQAGEARVIPVILRPADWQTARFAKLQALPTGGEAITTWADQDSAFVDVVRGIRAAIRDLRPRPLSAEPLAGESPPDEPNETSPRRAAWRWAVAVVVAVAALAIYFAAGRDGESRPTITENTPTTGEAQPEPTITENTPTTGEGQPEPTADEIQRIFAGETASDEIVGRLALRLATPGQANRQVGADHIFRTDDFFRFATTSNRDGWLYVLHRPPGGELELLWPAQGEASANAVHALEPTVIPTGKDAFLFADDTGEEYFYVALLAASDDAPEERLRHVEKLIAGGGHGSAVAGQRRGVIIGRPGEDAPLYFMDAGDGVTAAVELRLRHE